MDSININLVSARSSVGALRTGRSIKLLRRRLIAGCAGMVLVVAGCSDSGGAKADGAGTSTSSSATTTAVDRPERLAGPSADLATEITGTKPPFISAVNGEDIAKAGSIAAAIRVEYDEPGFVQHEYLAKGTATAYTPAGSLEADGRWDLTDGADAPYVTRIIVRRPEKAADFSGTVLVEWNNVAVGLDGAPGYINNKEEILRAGHIWVGVSAQYLGVEPGPVLIPTEAFDAFAGKGLRAIDPERYKDVSHPGDAYSFDIFTQVSRALLAGGDPLGGMTPTTMIAFGESASATAMTTYYNAVQPLTEMFDGFYIVSRGAFVLPLVGTAKHFDPDPSIGEAAVKIRDDLAAPVMDVQAEGDLTGLFNSLNFRQDDSDTFRLWEVAGTAHIDRHVVGPEAETANCSEPINDGPLHFVAYAALRALIAWVENGTHPPEAPRIETTDGATPAVVRNSDGIAEGGIRSPLVDVPVEVLSGRPSATPGLICSLYGTTKPLTGEEIAARYRTAADYQTQYQKSADAAIAAGFVLAEDREALLDAAQPDRVGT